MLVVADLVGESEKLQNRAEAAQSSKLASAQAESTLLRLQALQDTLKASNVPPSAPPTQPQQQHPPGGTHAQKGSTMPWDAAQGSTAVDTVVARPAQGHSHQRLSSGATTVVSLPNQVQSNAGHYGMHVTPYQMPQMHMHLHMPYGGMPVAPMMVTQHTLAPTVYSSSPDPVQQGYGSPQGGPVPGHPTAMHGKRTSTIGQGVTPKHSVAYSARPGSGSLGQGSLGMPRKVVPAVGLKRVSQFGGALDNGSSMGNLGKSWGAGSTGRQHSGSVRDAVHAHGVPKSPHTFGSGTYQMNERLSTKQSETHEALMKYMARSAASGSGASFWGGSRAGSATARSKAPKKVPFR
jgi:hypothetical protein